MEEYILHEEYYKSIRGEDGEEPLAVHGSRPRTDLGSYTHSEPAVRQSRDSIPARTTETRVSKSMLSNPKGSRIGPDSSSGTTSSKANLRCPGSYGRPAGQTSVRIRRSRCDGPIGGH